MPIDLTKFVQEKTTTVPSNNNERNIIPKPLKKISEFGTGAVLQVPKYASNLVGSLVKLTKHINPNDIAAKYLGLDVPEYLKSEFLGEKIQEAGESVQKTAKRGYEIMGGDPSGAFKAGGTATDLALTIVGTMMAPKPKAFDVSKLQGNSGYLLGKMRNFALKQAGRFPVTATESVAASGLYAGGVRGEMPSYEEIERNAKIDLGMQLALGVVGAIARPFAKGVAKGITGVGDQAFEGVSKAEIAKKTKKALAGEFNIARTTKAAREAYPEIQKEASRVYKESLKKYLPDAKNIKLSNSYKLQLLSNIDNQLSDRIRTLTDVEINELDRLKEIIVKWNDNSIDGWRDLSIKMGNEIRSAVALKKVPNSFNSAKFIIDGSIDDVLNKVTDNAWSKVNETYKPYKELQLNLKTLLNPNTKTVESFLRQGQKDGISRVALKKYFEELDKIAGTKITEDLTALLAASEFESGSGVIGNWIANFGLGKPLGQILTSIAPALDRVNFSNYMAVPIGITKTQFIPLDNKNSEPQERRLGIPTYNNGGGTIDFGL